MKRPSKNQYFRGIIFVLSGIILGWLMFHRNAPVEKQTLKIQTTVWTCAMHPQIRREAPGKCPICGMDLVPLNQLKANLNPDKIQMDENALQLAHVRMVKVSKVMPVKEIRLYGKIKADERAVQIIPAHISGRIEKLIVNSNGETIQKGQLIAEIYSPELITAQQEFFEAIKSKTTHPEFYEAAKEKLLQLKITLSQINEIETSQIVKNTFGIISPVSGIANIRKVNVGDYVARGQTLFEVVDLSNVWALFDVYENDFSLVKIGASISFKVPAIQGKMFEGKITFIDPQVDDVTRVARVRVEVNNIKGDLKPEMFVNGTIRSKMDGVEQLMIPKSAVLWTGKQSLVYVKDAKSKEYLFAKHTVELGADLGGYYVILGGLKEGEEVVAEGTFAIDAAAQLEGKPSMMKE